MDELRLILLGVGAVFIALIYLWGMRSQIRARLRRRQDRAEPSLNSGDELPPAAPPPADPGRPDPVVADPNDPLASKRLVDVEITPIRRTPQERAQGRNGAASVQPAPTPGRQAPPPAARKPEPPPGPAGAEAPRTEAKAEAPKAETPKAETPKAETPKAETPKAETPKAETPKAETPKAETPKAETPKAETPGPEAPETQPPEAEPVRTEAPRVEPPPEPPRAEPVRPTPPPREVKAEARELRQEDKDGPEMAVALTVVAPRGQFYQGSDIAAACEALGLKPSPSGLYEAYDERAASGETRPVLGMAHLKNPGTFDFDSLENLSTPGLLLFARLPGPLDGISTLERIATIARDLATRLGGAVCDERRNKLTQQALGRLRYEITEFERQMRVRSQAHG